MEDNIAFWYVDSVPETRLAGKSLIQLQVYFKSTFLCKIITNVDDFYQIK